MCLLIEWLISLNEKYRKPIPSKMKRSRKPNIPASNFSLTMDINTFENLPNGPLKPRMAMTHLSSFEEAPNQPAT